MTAAPFRPPGTWPPTPAWLRSPAARASPSAEERPPRGGNKQLERALFLSAFAALADPTSRACYDRTRAAGKRHNAALIGLARRRVDVLFAMLRDGTVHQPRPAPAARPNP